MSGQIKALAYSVCKKQIKIDSRLLIILSIGYLYLPLFLFYCTWVKVWIGIPCILIGLYGCICLATSFWDSEPVRIRIISLVIILTVLLGIGLVSGWGGYMPQAGDWAKHNAVLKDLVEYGWPVYYKEAVSPSMLTYYVGAYLIPAACGKLTGSFRVAEIMMYIWGEAGLALVVLNLFRVLKANSFKRQFVTVLMLFLFSGALILGQNLYEIISGAASSSYQWMTSVNGSLLQYRSNFVDLRWVMPQCLACWLAIVLWWEKRRNIENYAALLIPCFLTGIFPFLGMVIIAVICMALEEKFSGMTISAYLRRMFSISNIIISIVDGGVLFLYYAGNVFSEKSSGAGFTLQELDIWLYLAFVVSMFGIYSLLIWRQNRTNGLFWGGVILLLLLPFFSVGICNDLVMSGGIPGMFIVMICVLQYLFSSGRNQMIKGILIGFLVIGALNPLKEIGNIIRSYDVGNLYRRAYQEETMETFSNLEDEDIEDALKYNYFSYHLERNLFARYIAEETWK